MYSILLLRILIRAPTEQPPPPNGCGFSKAKSPRCLQCFPPGPGHHHEMAFGLQEIKLARSGAISGWIVLIVAKDDLNYLTRPLLLFQNVIEGIESPVQLPN